MKANIGLDNYYIIKGNNTLDTSFIITAAFVPFFDSLLTYNSYWNGKKDFKSLSLSNILTRLINLVTIIGVIIFTKNIIIILNLKN